MPRLVLGDMSWPELEAHRDDIRLAIIPTGSCEQHGPNLAMRTDTTRAREIAGLLAHRLYPRVLVCPEVPVGVSYHHMNFAGTLTLQPETFIAVLVDMARSLKQHGIDQVLFLNAHGGNRHSLGIAVVKLHHELGVRAAWVGCGTDLSRDLLEERGASPIRGHACEGEVAQSWHLDASLVKVDALSPGELKDTPYQKRPWWGEVFWRFDDITGNGALGDATKASPQLGRDMTELVLRRLERFAGEYFLGREMPDDT